MGKIQKRFKKLKQIGTKRNPVENYQVYTDLKTIIKHFLLLRSCIYNIDRVSATIVAKSRIGFI
jgi:hypothetical protein